MGGHTQHGPERPTIRATRREHDSVIIAAYLAAMPVIADEAAPKLLDSLLKTWRNKRMRICSLFCAR